MKLAACFSQAEQAAGMIPRGLVPESDPPSHPCLVSLIPLGGAPDPLSLSAREANWGYLAVRPVLIPPSEEALV